MFPNLSGHRSPLYLRFVLFWLCALAVGLPVRTSAATLPSGFTESLVAGGLSRPTAMEFAPDGRLFVCEQGGSLRVIKNGALLPTPFLTVPVDSSGERGLLGVTFDPNFAVNRYVYVYYTATTPAVHNRVSRFTANGDVAVPGSERAILDLNNLSSANNHNGGAIHFGSDGHLYVAVGDNNNPANAQTLTNLLGKMLRIGADGSIPSDNPFVNSATGINRAIWAYGLRNPFTFAFQRGTGRLFINDVGQSAWEEINDGQAGANYGWPNTEGPTMDPRFVGPIFAYGHGTGPTVGCAVTGGAFYDAADATFPAQYQGRYFFADLCSGWIRVLNPADNSVSGFAAGISSPVDLKVGLDGGLYYLAAGSGAVYRIQYTADPTPGGWQAVDVAVSFEGAPSGPKTHLLWRNTSGEISLWTVDAAGGVNSQRNYGPYANWSALAIDVGPDNLTRVLWQEASGIMGLWTVDAAGGFVGYSYGPFAGWSPIDIAVGPDNLTRLLRQHTSGEISLWTVDAAGGVNSQRNYGPYANWSALAIDVGPDNLTRVLWQEASGIMGLWTVDAAGGFVGYSYGPFAGWSPIAVDLGPDNLTRLLRGHSSGEISLWTVDAAGGVDSQRNYGRP